MNLSSTIWRCMIMLLIFSIERCPLIPTVGYRFMSLGNLTVEPAQTFHMGSNLTVYCHVRKCQRGFKMSLELNGATVDPWKRVSCTTTIFNLPSVRTPLSIVLCKLNSGQLAQVVGGLDLHAGLPPDKPGNIICETTRSSDFIDCSWERGQETHLRTSYNISVNGENGTQIHSDQTQDAGKNSIPRAMLDENSRYVLNITAYNQLGVSQSDPFILCVKDTVRPETPHITQIEFGVNSIAASLRWKTAESSVHLRPYIRLHTDKVSWEAREVTELSEGLIQVDNLRPLTEYEFQMRTCHSASGLTGANTSSFTTWLTTSKTSLCSKWSPSVRKTSPGKGPSQQLHVWRMLGSLGTNGRQNVTVFWKPPPTEDNSGEVQEYKIFMAHDQQHEVTCAAAVSQCLVQVPAEVQTLSIYAVTSYGKSPPADVTLRHSGVLGPVLGEMAPAANGSAVFISWLWPGNKNQAAIGRELLYYVMEWESVPAAGLQWQKLDKDLKRTSITGLTAGVRYSVSLYAMTTRGVSAPSSSLLYSREEKPISAPNLSVLIHEDRRILIQWDELPVDQQRGFLTKYTIYFQMLDSRKTELNVTVPGSDPRQMWLDCPDGALALQLTASTSAGEGPRGRRICSQPAAPAVGLVIVIVFIIAVFIAIVANLMCWSCVRERIKQKCRSWGPAWLVENLPKPGRSNAIRLLEHDRSEPLFSSIYSDPPLSPIVMISQEERDEVYPTIHVESQTGSGQPTAETPLLMSDSGTRLVDRQLEHVSYKPQIAMLAPQGEEETDAEETQRDVPAIGEEDRCSSAFEGLLGGLLLSVDDSPRGLTLYSVSGLSCPKTDEISFLNRGFLQERRDTEDGVEADSSCLDLQQDDVMTPDTMGTCLSQCTGETILNGGYFPQVAGVSSTTL